MNCYIVSFQVKEPSVKLILRAKLKEYKYFCPINLSCWAIMSDETASEILNNLITVIKEQDRLFVIRSGTEAAWQNAYSVKHSEWLKRNL